MKYQDLTQSQNETNGSRIASVPGASGNGSRLILFGAAAATAGLMAAPSPVQATPSFTQPIGLSPGSDYLVLFVTTETTEATSTSISDYNNFVNSDAAAENPALPSTTWSAVASTATVSAVSNVKCGGCGSLPVYAIDGTLIAPSLDALFGPSQYASGTIDETPLYDIGGAATGAVVWTGTNPDGTSAAGNELGGQVGQPITGLASAHGKGFFLDNSAPNAASFPLYAISGELTVPAASTPVPEPASGSLLGVAAGVIALAASRRRRHAPSRGIM